MRSEPRKLQHAKQRSLSTMRRRTQRRKRSPERRMGMGTVQSSAQLLFCRLLHLTTPWRWNSYMSIID